MRLHTRSTRRRIDRITLNLASMIDVTFLLLIYFMVTTAIVRPEDRLSPTIQTQGGAATSDFQPQVLEVLQHGGAPAYRLGAHVVRERAELAELLRGLSRTEGLLVRVENHVPVGFAATAIQLARDTGFEQVTYVPAD